MAEPRSGGSRPDSPLQWLGLHVSRHPVSWGLAVFALLLTGITDILPSSAALLGGLDEWLYPWQPLSAVFVHGWGDVTASVHLLFNLILLLAAGPPVERLLGSLRFAGLCLAAIAAFAVVHWVLLVDGQGLSPVIWTTGPTLVMAWPGLGLRLRRRAMILLIVMWGLVPMLMTILAAGPAPTGDIIMRSLLANAFHISGILVGFSGALLFRRRIRAVDGQRAESVSASGG
jgi:membrane associated rhomboid family serine protease